LQKRLADLEQFHSLLDHSNDMIFMLDQDGRFTYVNRSVCDLLHYCSDELSRMTGRCKDYLYTFTYYNIN
jgi:PAS domain S-box-containing protein